MKYLILFLFYICAVNSRENILYDGSVSYLDEYKAKQKMASLAIRALKGPNGNTEIDSVGVQLLSKLLESEDHKSKSSRIIDETSNDAETLDDLREFLKIYTIKKGVNSTTSEKSTIFKYKTSPESEST